MGEGSIRSIITPHPSEFVDILVQPSPSRGEGTIMSVESFAMFACRNRAASINARSEFASHRSHYIFVMTKL
jgi:hypothetical protein